MRRPRCYQLQQFESVRAAFRRGRKAVIVEAPTGTGKTVSFTLMSKMATDKGGRVLILVNRDVLVNQTIAELKENGMFASREQSDSKARLTDNLVVGSIQSLTAKRLEAWPKDYFKLVMLDEMHGSASPSFKRVLDHFQSAYHVGFTATPERHDKAGLWKGYEEICFAMTLREAIDEGWLCGFEFVELDCPVTLDLKVARKAAIKENEEVFDSLKYLPRLAELAAGESVGHKGLFFLPNCRVSQQFAEMLKGLGVNARHVDSSYMSALDTEERLEWFKNEKEGILCNSQLLTTGYNRPEIDLIGTFRPFASTPLYKQALGRGTRPVAAIDDCETAEERRELIRQSAKPFCKVITPFWENGAHNLASPSALITDDEDEREMIDKGRKAGSRVDMDQMENRLKAAKTMRDQEEEMRKYAEKVANSQAKKGRSELYIDDILRKRNPAHKPATAAFIRYVRKLGAPIPAGDYSAYQIMRVKERLLAKNA